MSTRTAWTEVASARKQQALQMKAQLIKYPSMNELRIPGLRCLNLTGERRLELFHPEPCALEEHAQNPSPQVLSHRPSMPSE